jgi:hypothetical protein
MTIESKAALDAALKLASEGLACLPVGGNKHPTVPKDKGGNGGVYTASTDGHILRDLWCNHPGPLVGVATGTISNIDVLDIDQKPEGRAWWADNRHRIPKTRAHRTRSGGLHLVFRHASGSRNSAGRIARGIDTRGDGGYVIWWPATGLPVLSDAPVAPWPDWLLSQALPPPPPLASPVTTVSDGKLIRGILTVVARAVEGERNSCLHWAACRFAESTLARDDADKLLINAAVQIGLPITEARATVDSAYRRRARGG